MNPNDMPQRLSTAPPVPTNPAETLVPSAPEPVRRPATNMNHSTIYGPYPVGTVRVRPNGKRPATLELSRRKNGKSIKREFRLRVGTEIINFSPPVAEGIAETIYRLLHEEY